jgi:lipopolysaccharide/colanic/teichoic acid biosynthesis glycosyltransferase
MTVAEMTETRFLKRHARTTLQGEVYEVEPVQESSFFQRKHLVDRGIALVLLMPALPLMAVLILLIRLTSRGPGLFAQTRVGQGGRIFTMYKLRSMRIDAEAKTGPAWSATGADPRVTKLGYWLRRLHLDELPQLFNVLKGEMSLIGPRPERPEFVHVLADQIPGYLNRLMVHPGITGLAQINLPPDSDLESVRRKLIVDMDYIHSASLWLDLRIMVCTALRMLWIKGPVITKALGLERVVFLSASGCASGQLQPVSVSDLVDKARSKPARRTAASQN